jgi:hypothetical protein
MFPMFHKARTVFFGAVSVTLMACSSQNTLRIDNNSDHAQDVRVRLSDGTKSWDLHIEKGDHAIVHPTPKQDSHLLVSKKETGDRYSQEQDMGYLESSGSIDQCITVSDRSIEYHTCK